MKSLILLLLIVGIIFVAVGYVKTHQQCPPPSVEFRYIPRTFQEEQDAPIPVLAMFNKMFTDVTPWQKIVGYDSDYYRRSLLDPRFQKYSKENLGSDINQAIPNH